MSASIVGLWRYPVKSMQGESCEEMQIAARGIAGDRGYALVDVVTGKVASAKNPRLWSQLLRCSARYLSAPGTNGHAAPVEITLPSGERRSSADAGLADELSTLLGRAVRVSSAAPRQPVLEEYWPDLHELAHRDEITQEAMPAETFFDCAGIHLLTTNTLDALRARYAEGAFEVTRFRPNVLVNANGGGEYAEDAWVGGLIRIGEAVLRVTGGAPRCVMTTLAQEGLPADLGVLRTAARHHAAQVGVYAEVVQPGKIALGDTVVATT